jgi:hypothetical protein
LAQRLPIPFMADRDLYSRIHRHSSSLLVTPQN